MFFKSRSKLPATWPSPHHNKCNDPSCMHPNSPQPVKGTYNCRGIRSAFYCEGTYKVSGSAARAAEAFLIERDMPWVKNLPSKKEMEEMERKKGSRQLTEEEKYTAEAIKRTRCGAAPPRNPPKSHPIEPSLPRQLPSVYPQHPARMHPPPTPKPTPQPYIYEPFAYDPRCTLSRAKVTHGHKSERPRIDPSSVKNTGRRCTDSNPKPLPGAHRPRHEPFREDVHPQIFYRGQAIPQRWG